MARIAPPAHPGLFVRAMFFMCRKLYGRIFQPLQIAAHTPGLLFPLMMTSRFAHNHGTLPADTRMLAMQLVGELNHCSWCIDFGRSLASDTVREKMVHVSDFASHPSFSPAERAALRYTYEASQVP